MFVRLADVRLDHLQSLSPVHPWGEPPTEFRCPDLANALAFHRLVSEFLCYVCLRPKPPFHLKRRRGSDFT